MSLVSAQQALAILDALETLPLGASLYIDRTHAGAVVTVFTSAEGRNRHNGSSITDALGQACQVLALEGGAS